MGIVLVSVRGKINRAIAHSGTYIACAGVDKVCTAENSYACATYLDVFVVVVVNEDIDSREVADPLEFECQF